MKEPTHRRWGTALQTLILLMLAASGAAMAQAALNQVQRFDIPAQSTGDALNAFAKQSGLRLLFAYDAIQGRQASAISGDFTREEVLKRLLDGTGLHYEMSADSVVLIRAGSPTTKSATTAVNDMRFTRLAQADGEQQYSADATQTEQTEQTEPHDELSEVIVTGTNIRNVHESFSPVISITRDTMDREGLARASDYIARLPQNFGGGGGTTPDQNSLGAQAINLRGLGNEATLTLINGRRMAPSGVSGNLVDISAIPTAALERIDVLTDGASAIYGSDAIAGVVNFILRKDYNGSETRMRVGSGNAGSAQELIAAQTYGRTSDRGRLLFSYEYSIQDALDANDRDFTRSMPDPNEILPSSRRHSGLFSGALNLGTHAELFSDLYFNRRDSRQTTSFMDVRQDNAKIKQFGGTVGATLDFAGDWRAELSGSLADNNFYDRQSINPHPPIYVGLFQESQTRVWSVDGKVDGSLFRMPGGAARAVFGAQYRDEKHDGGSDFFTPSGAPLGVAQLVAHTSRNVSAAFTEFYLPFVSAQNALPGIRELSMSIAGRYESYSDFGSTFNPKIGLLWTPLDSVTLRSTYGTSFRAPHLSDMVDQISTVILADYVDPGVPSGTSVAAWVNGSSSNLNAEKSTSWTFGIDFKPVFARGVVLRGTYFNIDYDGRIASPQPSIDGSGILHDFPLPVERGVTAAAVQALANVATFPLINFTTGPGGSHSTINDVTVLLDSRTTNTSRSKVSGLDFAATYDLASGIGNWQLSLDSAYLFEAQDQFSVLRPVVSKLNTVGNPPDLRARGGATWSRSASAVSLFYNYVDGYRDIQPLAGPQNIASWSTVDASYHYDFGYGHSSGLLSGAVLTVSVLNLLDRDPPSLTQTLVPGAGTRQVPYDVANADPQGRILAVQITKRW